MKTLIVRHRSRLSQGLVKSFFEAVPKKLFTRRSAPLTCPPLIRLARDAGNALLPASLPLGERPAVAPPEALKQSAERPRQPESAPERNKETKRKGLQRKSMLLGHYGALEKNLCSESVIAFFSYTPLWRGGIDWNGKPGP